MIRRAKEEDINGINRLLFQVQQIHAEKRSDIFRKGQKKYTDDEILRIINDDARPVFVFTDEKENILGYVFCIYQITKDSRSLSDRRVIYIDDLCVDEAFRGKHIGYELCRYVENFGKENGFDSITLNVWNLNEGAYGFYNKCGFEPLKVTMEKRINV
ncbi:MAG: GNAT family N-acetyltransferase [Clostridia bacterium]|nr:GNAT family N-acetyltransferase [Clostridia bacterium]